MINHHLFPASPIAKFNMVIVHGMVEHSLRYREFAQFIAAQGGNVITFDLRGHGQYHTKQAVGDFGHDSFGGAKQIFTDIEVLFASFQNDLPNILFGHSMGSAIALRYAQTHHDIRQVFMTGAPVKSPWLFGLAYHLAKLEHKLRPGKRSIFNNTFVEYNKHYVPNETSFDWLSANRDNILNYVKDPLCGFSFTPKGFMDMFEFMRVAFDLKEIAKIPKSVSFAVLWGDDDPTTEFGRGTEKLCKQLTDAGLSVAQIEYPNMRHEILNETDREEVYADIARLIQA